jgi:hypothetical protein
VGEPLIVKFGGSDDQVVGGSLALLADDENSRQLKAARFKPA